MVEQKTIDFSQPVYHGSDNVFQKFEHRAENHFGGLAGGFGMYLTQNSELARSYTKEDGAFYTVDVSALDGMQGINDDPEDMKLTQEDVAEILKNLTDAQVENDGYPYILADFAGEVSEDPDEWPMVIDDVAVNLIENAHNSDEGDISIVNELKNVTSEPQLIGEALTNVNIGYSLYYADNNPDTDPELIVYDVDNLDILETKTHEQLLDVPLTTHFEFNDQRLNVYMTPHNELGFVMGQVHDVLGIEGIGEDERNRMISQADVESILFLEKGNPNVAPVREWMTEHFGQITKNPTVDMNFNQDLDKSPSI